MSDLGRVYNWIEKGIQMGKRYSSDKNGEIVRHSVAVQKLNSMYKVHIDEIKESNMAAEEFDIDITREVSGLLEIQNLLTEYASISLAGLTPLKGSRIFNPQIEN
jgi:hypothetical protein